MTSKYVCALICIHLQQSGHASATVPLNMTAPACASTLRCRCIGYQFFDLATNHIGRRSFFTTTDEEQWQLIRKGTAQAFSQANIR